jgi:hypothetical protein
MAEAAGRRRELVSTGDAVTLMGSFHDRNLQGEQSG